MTNRVKKQMNMESNEILKSHKLSIIYILLIIQIYSTNKAVAQTSMHSSHYPNIDSSIIINKAKLLTLSHYGVENVDTIMKNLWLQKTELYHTISDFYDIIKIESNQTFLINIETKKGKIIKVCGEDAENNVPCKYIMVFSYYTYRFYLITGFKDSEIKELDDEMSGKYISIYDIFSEDILKKLSIDFDCLVSKYLDKENKYNDKKCYKECGRCMEMAQVH